MANVAVRYIVNDVDESINFYTKNLDFKVEMKPDPAFAILSRGNLQLLLSSPNEKGGGGITTTGGWNRFHLAVDNLSDLVDKLKKQGAHFRGEIIEGVAGKQILLEDPSGNPIELFEYFKK